MNYLVTGEELDNGVEQALWTRARREKTELEVANLITVYVFVK